jgi:hypothetical protein
MADNLPELSHLQFAVLSELGSSDMSGRQLREQLAKSGIRKSGPNFYQMMARLEEARFVKGWYDQKIVEGQIIKERKYRILGDGISAMRRTEKFYAGRLRPAFL